MCFSFGLSFTISFGWNVFQTRLLSKALQKLYKIHIHTIQPISIVFLLFQEKIGVSALTKETTVRKMGRSCNKAIRESHQ